MAAHRLTVSRHFAVKLRIYYASPAEIVLKLAMCLSNYFRCKRFSCGGECDVCSCDVKISGLISVYMSINLCKRHKFNVQVYALYSKFYDIYRFIV